MNPNFTPAEKEVLHGLVKYPNLNDREMSEIIGVKPSTTTAIRRRLREKDVFSTRRIPMGHRLGYEILAVGYGKIRPTLDEKYRKAFLKWVEGVPHIFFSLACSDAVLNIAYLENYSKFREYADTVSDKFKHSELVDPETWVPVIFGFDTCKLLSFFDYGPAVRHAFEMEEQADFDLAFEKPAKEKLTKKERSVLQGLVLHPEDSDKMVAEKIKASRQAVSSMRKRFESIGLLKTVRIVNLEKVGYKILALAHSVFTPKAPIKARKDGIRYIQETIPSILSVASNPENVLFAPTLDYDEYHRMRTNAVAHYMGKGYLRQEPRITLFPLSDTKTIKNFDFSGFMKVVAQEEL